MKGLIKKSTSSVVGYAWPAELLKMFPKRRRGPLERKFLRVLDAASSERPVHEFLKKHDYLVGMTFRSNTHPAGVVSEFELGAEFRCDFLILSHCSAWWTADFVELESPNARIYLKDRTQSKHLRVAVRQVRDWERWTRENEAYFRQRLSNLFEKMKLPASGALSAPDAAAEIRDPRCNLTTQFHVVIGRRLTLLSSEQQAKAQDSRITGVDIATYDRLLQVASRFDQADKWQKDGIKHWKG